MSPLAAARTLRAVSALYAIVALVWASAAFAPIDAPGRLLIDLLDWPLDGNAGPLDPLARWTHAVGAGFLLAVATLFLLVVAPAVERGERRTVRAAAAALGLWFLVDTAGALANGMGSALWNVLFLLGALLPLLAARGPRRDATAVGDGTVDVRDALPR